MCRCAVRLQAPSVFNGPLQSPWYQPRGVFLQPPTAQLECDGTAWRVTVPATVAAAAAAAGCPAPLSAPLRFSSFEAMCDLTLRAAHVAGYRRGVAAILEAAQARAHPTASAGRIGITPRYAP